MCDKRMTLVDLRNPPRSGPVSPTPRSTERGPTERRAPCPGAFVAVGFALLLAGCELPSSMEELTQVFEGGTPEVQAEQAPAQPQDNVKAAATPAESTGHGNADETKPTRETILTAQKLLAGLGYEPGPLDGMAGPNTADAVRRYQADASLLTDGRITKSLVEWLSKLDRDSTGRTHDFGLASKTLPLYAVGDTFIYSDGRTETVTGIDGDRVQWQSNDGTVISAYRDFVLPAIHRETDLLSERTTVDGEPGVLWPLTAGREVSFAAKTEIMHKVSSSARSEVTTQWHCLVEPLQAVSVAAGTFDALRVVCRTSMPYPNGPSERAWYYAPRIRHFVRRDERFESPDSESQVELVAVRLEGDGWPPAARAGLGWALQQALETKTDKQSIEWRSSGVEAEVTITPTTAMNTGESPYCRTFEQTVRRPRGQRIYPGKSCRSASGQWQIPGLEGVHQAAKSGS
jgi:hypothetical protein